MTRIAVHNSVIILIIYHDKLHLLMGYPSFIIDSLGRISCFSGYCSVSKTNNNDNNVTITRLIPI